MQPPLPDTQSECAYSASIPDSPLPAMLPISFERDDKPFRPKSLPRHSPLIRPNINNNAKHDALTTELSTYSNHEPYDQLSVSLSVPESGTSSVKTTVTDQASSLFYGFLMGVFPPLILLRTMFALCFPMLDSPEILNHRYYVYGRSLGMLTLVIVIIIVVVVVIKLR